MNFQQIITTLLLLLVFTAGHGQPNFDSLQKGLPEMKDDTDKVAVLGTLAMSNRDVAPQKAIEQAKEALTLAQKLNWKPGIANAHNVLGICY